MTELSLIASRLNIRAVDLDGKSPDELLHSLINIISKLDKEFGADTASPRAEVIGRIVLFLQTHKCDLLPSLSSEDEWDDWISSKDILYSLLHWTFSNSDQLTKRCYLAPFLMPIEVPTEILSDQNDDLYEMFEGYRELQHDFVEVHKAFESLKESKTLTTSELSIEIDNADREKNQLLQRDQRMTDNNPKFQQLLSLTSSLREEQARELLLEQQKMDQLQTTESAEKCLQEFSQITDVLSSNQNSIDQCIAELERESQKAVENLETQLIPKRLELEAMVAKAEVNSADPSRPEDNVEYLEELLYQMEEKLNQKSVGQPNADVSELLKQADASSSRLFAVEQDLNKTSQEKSAYATENQRLRVALSKKDAEVNLEELQSSLQEKTKLYEAEKEKISAAQQHLLELEGKKEELTKGLEAVEQTLQHEEEKGEISGYREVSKQLGNTFQETCVLNEIKSETLDEMSTIVENIAVTLDGKKQILEPMIAQLKQERAVFQQIRDEHNISKSRYEELQRKLAEENKSLEERFSQMQKECEEREILYRLLITTETITASTLEQKLEELPQQDEPSFPTASNLNQLYEDKNFQLQQLRNELDKKHQDKKGGHDFDLKQDAMFQSLKKLLEMKQRSLLTTSS